MSFYLRELRPYISFRFTLPMVSSEANERTEDLVEVVDLAPLFLELDDEARISSSPISRMPLALHRLLLLHRLNVLIPSLISCLTVK